MLGTYFTSTWVAEAGDLVKPGSWKLTWTTQQDSRFKKKSKTQQNQSKTQTPREDSKDQEFKVTLRVHRVGGHPEIHLTLSQKHKAKPGIQTPFSMHCDFYLPYSVCSREERP